MRHTSRWITAILLVLSVPVALAQAPLKLGDDVRAAFASDNPSHMVFGAAVVDIPEGTIAFYKKAADSERNDRKYLVVLDRYVVGVLQDTGAGSEILVDADGNGTLDYASNVLRVPFWVVAREYSHTPEDADNVRPYMDHSIQNFNSTADPYSTGRHARLLVSLLDAVADPTTPNRDLLYALFDYHTLGNRYPWAAMQAIRYVTDSYLNRYPNAHPILYLHTAESMINLGQSSAARDVVAFLVQSWPGFIPGRVYEWQLEPDPERRRELYQALKNSFPNHWIVLQL